MKQRRLNLMKVAEGDDWSIVVVAVCANPSLWHKGCLHVWYCNICHASTVMQMHVIIA